MKRLVFLLMCCVTFAGCGTQGALLGTESSYLLTADDAISLPGRPVRLHARLQAGDLLQGQPGHVVRFYLAGHFYGAAMTGSSGVAEIEFVPERPGEYVFLVDVAPGGFPTAPPRPEQCVVVCRPADAPLLVVDLDKTLVESGFQEVLLGDPKPMPDSPRVMERLAEKYTVVYLTHRPDALGTKSRRWLAAQGYPTGPLLLSDLGGFLAGSEKFKSSKLNEIQQDFRSLQLGIGDKITDAKAYHANGIRAYLIVMPWDFPSPSALRELAGEIQRELAPQVQVVTGWKEVEQGVFEGATFPPARMVKMLEERAAALEKPAEPDNRPAPATQVTEQ